MMLKGEQILDETKLSVEHAYEEVGTNYRFFLTWRHRLLAGYFIVVASMCFGIPWIWEKDKGLLWAPFAAGMAITVVFWVLDFRNRDLYHACQKVGETLESTLPENLAGIYGALNQRKRNVLNHSRAFEILFLAALALMAYGLCWAIGK
jgi:hypothetical protein